MSPLRHNTYDRQNRRRLTRKGAVAAIELLLALPILLLVLLGVVQFSTLFAKLEQVSLASRDGGLAAARTPDLGSFTTVPPDVMEIIQKQLDSANIELTEVRLEHNIGGGPTVLRAPDAAVDCGPPRTAGPNPPREWVRVTVCVKLKELMPNLLAITGFSAEQRVAKTSVLYRYDETTP